MQGLLCIFLGIEDQGRAHLSDWSIQKALLFCVARLGASSLGFSSINEQEQLLVLLGINASHFYPAISEHSPRSSPPLTSLLPNKIHLFLMCHTPHQFDKLISHKA